MIDRLLYFFVLAIRTLLAALPISWRRGLLDGVADLFFWIDRYHRQIVVSNLAYTFGSEMSEEKRAQVARACFRFFAQQVGDLLISYRLDQASYCAQIRVEDDGLLKELLRGEKSVILLTWHYGPWEMIAQVITLNYKPVVTIGNRLRHSPKLTQLLFSYRERFGLKVFSPRGALKEVMRHIKRGFVFGALLDQATREGVRVHFFGHTITYRDTAARLARQMGATIVPSYAFKEPDGQTTVRFLKPITPESTLDKEQDIIRMVQEEVASLETVIRRDPVQYFWLHKRFKHDAPEVYAKPSSKSFSS